MGSMKVQANRKLFLLAALLLVCAAPASAQLTTVTGTVADPIGVTYYPATIKAQLVTTAGSPVTGQPTVTINNQAQCVSAGAGSAPCQVPFQGTVGPTILSSTGSFTLVLQDNNQVTPAGTKWLFTVSTLGVPPPAGTGAQTFSASITITGASQNVTAALDAAAPTLGSAAVAGVLVGMTNSLQTVLTLCNNAAASGGSGLPGCTAIEPQAQIQISNGVFQINMNNNGCQSSLYLDTAGLVKLFPCFASDAAGFAADGSIQVCFPTGAVSGAAHDCTDPNVWIWRGSGQIAKVMGRAVCLNANAACGYFPTPMWAAGFSALTIDLAPFTLITTGAFNGDTTAAPGGSGLYEFDFWLEATTAVSPNNITVALLCNDPGGTQRTVSSTFPFQTVGAIAQGSLYCFSNTSSNIQVSYTNSNASKPNYDAKGSLWQR